VSAGRVEKALSILNTASGLRNIEDARELRALSEKVRGLKK
jgi:hypothetical protein